MIELSVHCKICFGTTICCWDLSFFLQSFRAILPVWTDAYNTQIYIHTPTFTSLRVHAHIHMHTHSIQINAHAGLYVPETHHINYYFEANIYNYIYNLTLHASEYVSHRFQIISIRCLSRCLSRCDNPIIYNETNKHVKNI